MKNYTDSDYALNKFASGIVYRFADRIVEITREDFLMENSGKTAADFETLKAESDAIFLEQARRDTAQGNKSVPLSAVEDIELCSVRGADYAVIEEAEEAERNRKRRELGKKALDKLTKVQRRRYLLHHANGLTVRQIADSERVSHIAVVYSLEQAEKKIKKFLSNA
jgi:DNA-directed RNA polymerase specialized sigma24 family protein